MIVPKLVSSGLNSLGLNPDSGLRSRVNEFISVREQSRNLRKIAPRTFYGQFGEDAVLQAFLPALSGFYIDIGSGHPITGSNTYALYELGWRGILVDPVKSNIEMSGRARPGDRSIHAAVGCGESEVIDFIEFETYQYSTTSEARALEVNELGHKIAARYQVTILPLDRILPRVIPDGPTVMSIDVEGGEMGVLLSNDWDKFRPDVLLVEDLVPPIQKSTEVSEFLSAKNYELIAIAGVTGIYRLRG